jgi:hypothetical protein
MPRNKSFLASSLFRALFLIEMIPAAVFWVAIQPFLQKHS